VALIHCFSPVPKVKVRLRVGTKSKTICNDHCILDAIQGRLRRNAVEGGREVTIKTQAVAITKLPRHKVILQFCEMAAGQLT
jgi:hypothetical protein